MKRLFLPLLFLLLPSAAMRAQFVSQRPAESERLFRSEAVENAIAQISALLLEGHPSENVQRLAWMFQNCLPNTLDTTVHFKCTPSGAPDTFVYTGDIAAMWLRDSGAQVWPYMRFIADDAQLKEMVRGVLLRQWQCILLDPYANAFYENDETGYWATDLTDMRPGVHERKWELDSHCYPLRLAREYLRRTGDADFFGEVFEDALQDILQTMREQQRRISRGPYAFMRQTERALDTLPNKGWGSPVRYTGMVASAFRPSDDATTFQYLIPSNFFAQSALRGAAEILEATGRRADLRQECLDLADDIAAGLRAHATAVHPRFGTIYAYETDGYGNHLLMDDANVPSLLSMGYLNLVAPDDSVYLRTREFVWSEDNPYFFRGTAGSGVGGPHVGFDMIWPMSIMMKAFTARDDAEVRECLLTLIHTAAGTGFMHESFHKDDANDFTREWFAWQNSLFGELVLTLVERGKLSLLRGL